RRALEHLGALLELLTQLLLHRLQILERRLRLLARELLCGVIQLLHLRHELWRERVAKQLLRFLELPGQAAVERARLLELLLDRRRRLLKLLHLVCEVALILRDGLRFFGRVVAHRASFVAGATVRVARRLLAGGPLRAIACGFARTLLERLLSRRGRFRLAHRGIERWARDGATLFPRWNIELGRAALALLCA